MRIVCDSDSIDCLVYLAPASKKEGFNFKSRQMPQDHSQDSENEKKKMALRFRIDHMELNPALAFRSTQRHRKCVIKYS